MRLRHEYVWIAIGSLIAICVAWGWFISRSQYLNLTNDGTTTDSLGTTLNVEAEQQFFAAYQRGKPGQWQHIQTTIEGDPVTRQLSYFGSGTTYQMVVDARHDQFGSGRIERYTCQRLFMLNGRLAFDECTKESG
ncbi:DUF4362 domain-containing protein [Microcoleus sp. FACHB-1515]|uniref:DUF4362 domain-containing protein n=1 Tax=Cyanophyceae TaxID=3028117 RepID=UPI001688BFDD|nr:DUF4362 domain-containing protein [Microcoleus sp. FACHB-1515]MBD2091198.1 DUF4362 domain-containing protein [Microcoleus sp. FACHB-1515]